MGLMDKVKSQASALADKAQEGAKVGQERLMQMQSKRQADAMLLELGGLTYLAQAGRAQPGAAARAEELVHQLAAFEAAHGPISVTAAVPPPGEGGSYIPGGTAPAGTAPAGTPPAGTPPAGTAPADPAPAAAPATAPATGGGIPTPSYASDEESPGEG
jgi:hypothetical protein